VKVSQVTSRYCGLLYGSRKARGQLRQVMVRLSQLWDCLSCSGESSCVQLMLGLEVRPERMCEPLLRSVVFSVVAKVESLRVLSRLCEVIRGAARPVEVGHGSAWLVSLSLGLARSG